MVLKGASSRLTCLEGPWGASVADIAVDPTGLLIAEVTTSLGDVSK